MTTTTPKATTTSKPNNNLRMFDTQNPGNTVNTQQLIDLKMKKGK